MAMAATWGSVNGVDADGMKWIPVIAVSVCLHAAIFSLMLFFPENLSLRRPSTGIVYEVQLVEMPGDKGAGKAPAPAKPVAPPGKKAKAIPPIRSPKPAKRIAEVKREKKPVVVAKKTVQKGPQPVKKREKSPSELIDQAISRIDRKVKSRERTTPAAQKDRSNPLDRAVSNIQDRVRRSGGIGRAGGFMGTVMQLYQANVHNWIAGNWSYPVALQRGDDLEATVLLQVQRDGSITSSRFVRKSSEPVFDESVLRAVERSNPLPPFPESYTRSHEEIEIRFTLEELEQM